MAERGMTRALANTTGEFSEHYVLYEAKSFRQARERTYLKWPSESYPCRMEMKEAGWFIVFNKNDELVAVCPYCELACKGWNRQYDPQKVHQSRSPKCVYVLNSHTIQIPSSPIVRSIPRHQRVPPSSHQQAMLPTRINSFEHWPLGSPHPSFDNLAEHGLFFTRQGTIVECFSCNRQMPINRAADNPMLGHTDQCPFANQLRDHPSRVPLNIQPSNKVYELVAESIDNTTFYFLRCSNPSTPVILLSAKILLSLGQGLEVSDNNFKPLRPSQQLQKKVNWKTGSDGPLVNILENLASNPLDLSRAPDYLRCSPLPTTITNNISFPCKTCLKIDTSPHIVSIKCCHLGICSRECFPKWMTCVICGYTLGKTVLIFRV